MPGLHLGDFYAEEHIGNAYVGLHRDCNESRPYPSDNAKCQIDVMFLTHPPSYDNVKLTRTSKDSYSNPPTHNVNLTFCVITWVWKAPLRYFKKLGNFTFKNTINIWGNVLNRDMIWISEIPLALSRKFFLCSILSSANRNLLMK